MTPIYTFIGGGCFGALVTLFGVLVGAAVDTTKREKEKA